MEILQKNQEKSQKQTIDYEKYQLDQDIYNMNRCATHDFLQMPFSLSYSPISLSDKGEDSILGNIFDNISLSESAHNNDLKIDIESLWMLFKEVRIEESLETIKEKSKLDYI